MVRPAHLRRGRRETANPSLERTAAGLALGPHQETSVTDEPKADTVDSRKEVLDFLKDLQSHYGTYHNHKENVGWAGVALFVVLMAGVASVLRQYLPPAIPSMATRIGMSVVVVGAAIVCWLYVQKQFDLRKRAADLVAACIFLQSRLVSDPSALLKTMDWAPPPQTAAGSMQSSHVLPRAVLQAADELSVVGQTSRGLLERCAFALLLGITASLLLAIVSAG